MKDGGSLLRLLIKLLYPSPPLSSRRLDLAVVDGDRARSRELPEGLMLAVGEGERLPVARPLLERLVLSPRPEALAPATTFCQSLV